MPQIWMTYGELADLLQCGGDETFARIRADRLDRKISHDGHKRVKLNLALMGMFLERVRTSAQVQDHVFPLDQAVAELREIHKRMSNDSDDDMLFEPMTAADKSKSAA